MNKKLSFSILGDSYSTYEGWIPAEYPSWYGSWEDNVQSVEDTWWYMLSRDYGMSLLYNCSYSGSTVCTTGYEDMSDKQSFVIRMKDYFGEKNVLGPKADVIFVEGGINDTFANSPVGENQYENWSDEDLTKALPAFCYVIHYLKQCHPHARIICMISFTVSLEIETGYVEACEHYGIEYVIFPSGECKNGHPTAKGHRSIYETVRKYFDYSGSTQHGTIRIIKG